MTLNALFEGWGRGSKGRKGRWWEKVEERVCGVCVTGRKYTTQWIMENGFITLTFWNKNWLIKAEREQPGNKWNEEGNWSHHLWLADEQMSACPQPFALFSVFLEINVGTQRGSSGACTENSKALGYFGYEKRGLEVEDESTSPWRIFFFTWAISLLPPDLTAKLKGDQARIYF